MAVKPRPELGDIATGDMELTEVTSRPIDVFVAPSTQQVSPAVNELIYGLEKFNPALSKYKQAKYETFTKAEEAKAEKAFNKTKTSIKKAVRSGEIPPGASPEFVNKWVALDLKRKARDFKTQLFNEYDKQNILENSDPDAFNKFFDEFSSQFKTDNKLDGYDAVSMSEGFLPKSMSAYAELNSQHINGRVAVIEKKAKEDLGNEIFDIGRDGRYATSENIDKYFTDKNEGVPPKNKRLVFIARKIRDEAQILIDAGLDTADAQVVIQNSVKNLALEFEDRDVLKVFEYIETVDGGYMSETQAVKNIVRDTKREITKLRLETLNQKEREKELDDKQDTEAIINGFTALIDDLGIELITNKDLEELFQTGITREDGKFVEVDAIKREQLFELRSKYLHAMTLVDEKEDVIHAFYVRITKNPTDSNIKKDLISSLGTNINDTTFRTILTFQETAVKSANHFHYRSEDFKQMVKDLDEVIADYTSESVSKQKAIQGVKEFRQQAIEFLNINPDVSKADFDKQMDENADKILIKLLSGTKLKKIIGIREDLDTESYLQTLKKIIETSTDEDRAEVIELLNAQDQLREDYLEDFSIMTEAEYNKQMNEINNQLLELNAN
jgi:hypothetical protein